ncbi:uncharacterized protein V6R79_010516 [Siganus canaliculatus]
MELELSQFHIMDVSEKEIQFLSFKELCYVQMLTGNTSDIPSGELNISTFLMGFFWDKIRSSWTERFCVKLQNMPSFCKKFTPRGQIYSRANVNLMADDLNQQMYSIIGEPWMSVPMFISTCALEHCIRPQAPVAAAHGSFSDSHASVLALTAVGLCVSTVDVQSRTAGAYAWLALTLSSCYTEQGSLSH